MHIDPVRYRHGRGHDERKHLQIQVDSVVVVVQKTAAVQIQVLAARARRHDEGGVVNQAPFGPDLYENLYAISVKRHFEPPLLQALLGQSEATVLGALGS